ncbi:MAG: 3-deoxy-D-manno-octulosonic acid transferase [Hyphococcus sp.]|nr:MAG: 3-deoxy-D-manno-octulosonic acid transferase [Marinicaulis sp.]
MKNSDYIIYVDESGDPNIKNIDPQYPMFALSFCIFQKEQYASTVSPSIQRFKFKHFNHDNVVLHELDIRKPKGQYSFLRDSNKRESFLIDLTRVIADAPMTIIAAVIKKDVLKQQYSDPDDPYEIALTFCLERTFRFMKELGQADQQTFIIAESRGKSENNSLELAFRRIVDGGNYANIRMPCFKLMFAAKGVNLGGMQLADLTARPIGLSVLRPDQPNRAYNTIEPKIRRGPHGIKGFGLKVFP